MEALAEQDAEFRCATKILHVLNTGGPLAASIFLSELAIKPTADIRHRAGEPGGYPTAICSCAPIATHRAFVVVRG
jgi:hypothetical protein